MSLVACYRNSHPNRTPAVMMWERTLYHNIFGNPGYTTIWCRGCATQKKHWRLSSVKYLVALLVRKLYNANSYRLGVDHLFEREHELQKNSMGRGYVFYWVPGSSLRTCFILDMCLIRDGTFQNVLSTVLNLSTSLRKLRSEQNEGRFRLKGQVWLKLQVRLVDDTENTTQDSFQKLRVPKLLVHIYRVTCRLLRYIRASSSVREKLQHFTPTHISQGHGVFIHTPLHRIARRGLRL